MRSGTRTRAVLAGAVAVSLVAAGVASAERFQVGKLILDIEGGFAPSKLPSKEYAPISLAGDADITTTDGTIPSPMTRAVIDFDRNGLLTTRGLPVCQPSRLENTIVAEARKACAKSIVGTGFAAAMVTFPDQPPIPATSPLTIFNGPKQGGNPTASIHAYTTIPAPTTFVVVSPIERTSGRYRYRVTSQVPPIAGGYGSLMHVDFKVRKIYKVRGEKLSYAAARCRGGRLQAQGEFTFQDGAVITGSAFRPCSVRK